MRAVVMCASGLTLLVLAANAQNLPDAGLRGRPTKAKIIAAANAHLTPKGRSWAVQEAAKLRSGAVQPGEVEKDAASVSDGVTANAERDDLVLAALAMAAGDQGAGNGAANPAIERQIDQLAQNLSETQGLNR